MKVSKYWVIKYDFVTPYGRDSDEWASNDEQLSKEVIKKLENDSTVYHYTVKEITEVRK